MFNITRNFCIKIVTVKDVFISSKNSLIATTFSSQQCANKGFQNLSGFIFTRNLSAATSGNDKVNEVDYDAITNGDKNLEHKLKVILLEAEVLRQEGKLVPPNEFIKTEQWQEALNLSRHGRIKYYLYLFKTMKSRENRKSKQVERQQKLDEARVLRASEPKNLSIEEFVTKYDLQHNNIFLRFRDTTINKMYNNRLIQAIQFGQKLVIDCGYDENMSKRENGLCAKQLMLMFAENRQHDDPFDLHFCNLNKNSVLYSTLIKFIPTLEDPDFPLNVHECSYLDLFSKKQLIYLTPHTKEEMLEYDHDAIYIVGGIVDKMIMEPLSLAKAKKEGLKMAKFPLDRYLQWNAGSGKSLTLNQVTMILNDMKTTGDWDQALRHVPRRKIIDYSISSNIEEKSALPYDKRPTKPKWVPSAKINFENLKFNPQKKQNNVEKKRQFQIKTIFND